MGPESPIWFIILAIAAILVVAFYMGWSRRSTPAPPPDQAKTTRNDRGLGQRPDARAG
jgi:hypothetical protein